MSEIWYFEGKNLFNIICPNKINDPAAAKGHYINTYQKGDLIYFPEDNSEKIYLIANGKVKIGYDTESGDEVIKAILTKGELFGEMAIFGEKKRSEYAMVLENNTTICQMGLENAQELMKDNKSFSFSIYKLIGLRIEKLERKLEGLMFKDVRTRLIDFLKDMARERGEKIGYEILIRHSLTQKDIAALIGSSRQTVAKLLNELKDDNLIHYRRNRILIRDLNKLK